jgi:hypothetical protein
MHPDFLRHLAFEHQAERLAEADAVRRARSARTIRTRSRPTGGGWGARMGRR